MKAMEKRGHALPSGTNVQSKSDDMTMGMSVVATSLYVYLQLTQIWIDEAFEDSDMYARQEKQLKDQTIQDKKKEFDRLRDDFLESKRAIKVMTGSEAQKVIHMIDVSRSFADLH